MGNMSCFARKDVGEYWKSVMNDQPMPESIRDRFDDDQIIAGPSAKSNHFVKEFDVRPSAIIYQMRHHSHHPHHAKPSVHDFDMKLTSSPKSDNKF